MHLTSGLCTATYIKLVNMVCVHMKPKSYRLSKIETETKEYAYTAAILDILKLAKLPRTTAKHHVDSKITHSLMRYHQQWQQKIGQARSPH